MRPRPGWWFAGADPAGLLSGDPAIQCDREQNNRSCQSRAGTTTTADQGPHPAALCARTVTFQLTPLFGW